jgi:hypothetical protein
MLLGLVMGISNISNRGSTASFGHAQGGRGASRFSSSQQTLGEFLERGASIGTRVWILGQ